MIGVGYRLSPKVQHPVYIEDAAAAVAWTFRNIASYGGDPDKIFVTGISAGGYLTAMVGLDKTIADDPAVYPSEAVMRRLDAMLAELSDILPARA